MSAREVRPKFGEWVRGLFASESTPTRDGMYVRTIRRTGRVNPGTWYELTDGHGKFWQFDAKNTQLLGRKASPTPVSDDAESITAIAIQIDGKDVYLPTWCAERVRKALDAPVFDMEAAVEAAMHTREFAAGAAFGIPDDAFDQFLKAIITAALPFLGTSCACDDIHPDMDALRRELESLRASALADARDAERYRFIRDVDPNDVDAIDRWDLVYDFIGEGGPELDAAIDAALAAQAAKE